MKKSILFLLLGLALCLSSCIKDGDLDPFKGNLDITGNFHPTFGMPVAHADINMGELLKMFQQLTAVVTFDPETEDHLLYISYDTIIDTNINFDNGSKDATKMNAKNGSKETVIYTYHQMLRGQTSIDLFDNIPNADQLQVNGVKASLDLFVKGFSQNQAINTLIQQYNVNPYIKNISITLIGQHGDPHVLNIDGVDTIMGTELIQGTTLHVVDTDFSAYLNCRPRSIRYQMDFYVPVTASAAAAGTTVGDLIRDSVKLESMNTRANLSANFPLELKCQDLPYSVDLDVDLTKLEESLSKVSEYISLGDSSFLFFDFQNTLPVELQFTDMLIDANGQVIRDANGDTARLGRTGSGVINGAGIEHQIAGSSMWVSKGVKNTTLMALIGHKQYEYLKKVKKIRLNFKVSTSKDDSGSQQFVSMRQEDKLQINAYIRANADLNFDYNILGSDKPKNNNK